MNQIDLSLKLISLGYKPSIILGSSGGCITGVLLLICGVSSVKCRRTYHEFRARVEEVLSHLDSTWYCRPWSSSMLTSRVIGMRQGYAYDRGDGEALVSGIDIDLDSQPEMWIGTHSRTRGKQQLFCTRAKGDSLITIPGAIYASGDVGIITKASVASSAVPTIVPGVNIGDDLLCDGGISAASPLTPCMKAYAEEQISYHVVYISPIRYNSNDDPTPEEIENHDTLNKIRSSMAGMLRDIHIADRNNGIRMVGLNAKKTTGRGRECLQRALSMHYRAERSFIELTPLEPIHTNFLEMKKGDALRDVQRARHRDTFIVRHWYVCS